MQIDLAYTGPILGIEAAVVAAEEGGFGGLWTSETKHDPFLTLALASRVPSSLDLGSGIAVAFARNPYSVAQAAWDLALVSGGRFRLGLGTQVKAHVTRRFSMPWQQPVGQMRDFLAAVRAVWHSFQSGEPLKHRGDFYQHTLLTPNFNPGPRDGSPIPLGLAAVGPKMTQLAGESADFVLLHPFTHPEFVRTVTWPALGVGLEVAGRERHSLEVVGSLFAFDSEHPRAAEIEATVRQKVAFYGSTPAYFQIFEALGKPEIGPVLNALAREGRWTEMGDRIEDDLLDFFRVKAPKPQIFTAVQERFQGLYDRVILTVPGQ